ncbi:Protein of unknown function [Oceanospirillum multiglobuliferum]|uniref:DUF2782 domain-containing protein n=1 Tax=Oceanospirillum multiglobuliferum TaxID=64969 RepID=A0A1T4S099_9GAMM|nr:DUF2782 domain-containing protein [Oceanospirillum multiglobuliferum]OPX54529.1 hypothetical protein BTE48_13645 [Oceanospirillum multiglobuliferum]SKA21710.1 Protein of unknown function [Oceanospirillum multiglobuliferum]
MLRALFFGLLLCLPLAQAQAENQQPEPEITIRDGGDRTLYEYRVNGVLYAIKVKPKMGPEYYLVDVNGDGNYVRSESNRKSFLIPEWVLLRW